MNETMRIFGVAIIFFLGIFAWMNPIQSARTTAIAMKAPLAEYAKAVPPLAHSGTSYETGISTSSSLLWMNDADLDHRLSDIKSLGTSWIRVDFSWDAIQPDGPTKYRWKKYDRLVAAAGAHQLKVLALLSYTPPWARESRCAALTKNKVLAKRCNPRSAEEFGQFARNVVQRYHDKSVRGWEIWNEPNLSAYWRSAQPDGSIFVDPKTYANLANAAALQIRQHTDAAILTGGLSPLFEPSSSTGMRQSDYLAELLPHLNHKLFDGIGIHPYSWPLLPGRAAIFNAFYTVNNGPPAYNLRTIMKKNGWADKQIWGTEYGASTRGVRTSDQSTKSKRADHVSEDAQAHIISQGVDEWYDKPNVGPLFLHSDSDEWLHKVKNEGGFGLRRSDGTKKPAYDALNSAVERLKDE